MTPEILKYMLIGMFALLIIGLLIHIVRHGVRMPDQSGDKPLFKARSPEQNRRDLVLDLLIGGAIISVLLILETCSGS